MSLKIEIEKILKHRFFVTPTGYPSQNGFLDYGPPLCQIKQNILTEFRRIFVTENVFEIEPSIVLPYDVLKNSGHIDKFCDVILSDSSSIYRADHFIEEKLGDIISVPNLNENLSSDLIMDLISKHKSDILSKKTQNEKSARKAKNDDKLRIQLSGDEINEILSNFSCTKKRVSDLTKDEIDVAINLYDLYSPLGLPFGPAKDFNLIFKLNDRQFLRPELAQSQFTNFRKLFEMNYERLPFSSLCIGRSYRNEISARGGMLRTKEFEQAEIEYFTEDGSHESFASIKEVTVLILPNTCSVPYKTTLGRAYEDKIISSQAICYFIAKSQEFLQNIGINLETIRFRQHNKNEMAHYAKDCWDAEIKTLSGWVESAGIADRSNFDLSVHSKEVNVKVKKQISSRTVYEIVLNKAEAGKKLKSKFKDLESYAANIDQTFIFENMQNDSIVIEFENEKYKCGLSKKIVDCEFFIPKVIEPSFGISRILYALVEQNFKIDQNRNVLCLPPKMCYMHCVIGFIKYLDEFEEIIKDLKVELHKKNLKFQVSDRGCSIGRKYYSCDEIGIPFFITFDFNTLEDKKVTIRERDSTNQIRINVKDVAITIRDIVDEKRSWADLFNLFKV